MPQEEVDENWASPSKFTVYVTVLPQTVYLTQLAPSKKDNGKPEGISLFVLGTYAFTVILCLPSKCVWHAYNAVFQQCSLLRFFESTATFHVEHFTE
jgi:hypothetical protein